MKKTQKEIAEELSKSLYKMVEKAYKAKVDTVSSKVVQDVLDADSKAEVDEDSIPTAKPSVLWKKDPKAKGVNKLKLFVKGKNK